ncbi:hypothetical protein [Ureaplasma parvum]|uniref:hypothetical protein n=1 Tax=Ureaplasma parvum TaxID=134821 RepID=UPI0026F23834|nr:hypothetical protein [Ureaplasma parvum]
METIKFFENLENMKSNSRIHKLLDFLNENNYWIRLEKTNFKNIRPVLKNRILYNDELIYLDNRRVYRQLLILLLKEYYMNASNDEKKLLDDLVI